MMEVPEKTGLDDYLCNHSVDEFKQLPVHEIRKLTIDEMIEGTTPNIEPDELKKIVKRIASTKAETEKSLYINKLSEMTDISKGRITKDVKAYETQKERKSSQAEALIAYGSELPLCHDQNKEAFISLNNETIPLRSKKVKQLLSYKHYQNTGKAVNSDSLNQAVTALEGRAIFESPTRKLSNRVASVGSEIWHDMGDGQALRNTAAGWSVTVAPFLFRRYGHQQPQTMPISGGDPFRIFEFLNISEEHRLLTLVVIISYFIPDIPHPIFHPHGAQGAGKTTLCRIIKKICDPSSIETLITPRDMTQLVQVIAHHHVCLFDNLSDLPSWMSDIIAQACTGGGFSKRQLYTDDEDVVYKVKRCIGLNGINLVISKPDLMDRSILLHLERINAARRKDETQLWVEFEEAKPKILGAIFDVISKAMRIYPDVKLEQLPRMADFAKWGYAIAEALGGRGREFLHAYQENVERQNEEVIQGNTLAQAILTFMADKESWGGTIKSAWVELNTLANPDKKDPTFPKTNRTLRKQLTRIKTNLMDLGVTFKISPRTQEGYPIAFQKDRNFASFGALSCNSLSDKDLAHEPNMKQNEPNEFDTSFDTFSKPLQNEDLNQNMKQMNQMNQNSIPFGEDLREIEI
ncbi:MAG: hypothetical protein GY941_23990 [Planctomycetes bacterium]|nr:hypothetical protein [Planctomycetota bacterium]